MLVHCGMFTKWRINIKGLESYKVTKNGDIYKAPFTRGNRSYGLRLIKMQYPNRWKLNNQWYSKVQLRDKLIEDDDKILIYSKEDMPF